MSHGLGELSNNNNAALALHQVYSPKIWQVFLQNNNHPRSLDGALMSRSRTFRWYVEFCERVITSAVCPALPIWKCCRVFLALLSASLVYQYKTALFSACWDALFRISLAVQQFPSLHLVFPFFALVQPNCQPTAARLRIPRPRKCILRSRF